MVVSNREVHTTKPCAGRHMEGVVSIVFFVSLGYLHCVEFDGFTRSDVVYV